MTGAGFRCHRCGRELGPGRVEFRAVCAGCGDYLHCCLNCRHYDPVAYHECRASATAEYSGDKEKANYCEEFSFAPPQSSPGPGKTRSDAEKLFRGEP